MDTVELLEQSLQKATRLGYRVRREWLGGVGGGACELKGQKILFLDLAQGPVEHLEQVREAIKREEGMRKPETGNRNAKEATPTN